jgi:hypothetical protein
LGRPLMTWIGCPAALAEALAALVTVALLTLLEVKPASCRAAATALAPPAWGASSLLTASAPAAALIKGGLPFCFMLLTMPCWLNREIHFLTVLTERQSDRATSRMLCTLWYSVTILSL